MGLYGIELNINLEDIGSASSDSGALDELEQESSESEPRPCDDHWANESPADGFLRLNRCQSDLECSRNSSVE
jgi:hypothetical protein